MSPKQAFLIRYERSYQHKGYNRPKNKNEAFFSRRIWVKEPRRSENEIVKKRYTLMFLS